MVNGIEYIYSYELIELQHEDLRILNGFYHRFRKNFCTRIGKRIQNLGFLVSAHIHTHIPEKPKEPKNQKPKEPKITKKTKRTQKKQKQTGSGTH